MTDTDLAERPETTSPALALSKANPSLPALELLGGELLTLRAGVTVTVAGKAFAFSDGADIRLERAFAPGEDFVVAIDEAGKLVAMAVSVAAECAGPEVLGGGHYAPGGCAAARAGGDDRPGINPHSLWDVAFRPACPDPRGMAYVAGSRGAPHVPGFWADIYLIAQDHAGGTSRYDALIGDGRNLPMTVDGSGPVPRFDFATAQQLLAHHGKGLLSVDEFMAAAYGVVEREAAPRRAERTALDAPRSSAFGLMQAAGQRCVWGHDGDPDTRRAAIFGGYWGHDDWAGSRRASVGDWGGDSGDWLSARGRSDHLQPA